MDPAAVLVEMIENPRSTLVIGGERGFSWGGFKLVALLEVGPTKYTRSYQSSINNLSAAPRFSDHYLVATRVHTHGERSSIGGSST